jgi:hypothetical protein
MGILLLRRLRTCDEYLPQPLLKEEGRKKTALLKEEGRFKAPP